MVQNRFEYKLVINFHWWFSIYGFINNGSSKPTDRFLWNDGKSEIIILSAIYLRSKIVILPKTVQGFVQITCLIVYIP